MENHRFWSEIEEGSVGKREHPYPTFLGLPHPGLEVRKDNSQLGINDRQAGRQTDRQTDMPQLIRSYT